MGRVSKKVVSGLDEAMSEAIEKINKPKRKRRTKAEMEAARAAENKTKDLELVEFGSPESEAFEAEFAKQVYDKQPKKKRKRRTKAEMEAARKQDKNKIDYPWHILAIVDWDKPKDIELSKFVCIPDSILVNDYDIDTISDYLTNETGYCHKGFKLSWEGSSNYETTCKWDLEQARLLEKEEPDFDFRDTYAKGEKVYFVRHHPSLRTKELYELTIRTVYPRLIVGTEDKKGCQCIGYNDRDYLFVNRRDAVDLFKSIKADIEEENDNG